MYKNVRWLHFNATSHSFPLSAQTAGVIFLLYLDLEFRHTLQLFVCLLQVVFQSRIMVEREADNKPGIGFWYSIKRVGLPIVPYTYHIAVQHFVCWNILLCLRVANCSAAISLATSFTSSLARSVP